MISVLNGNIKNWLLVGYNYILYEYNCRRLLFVYMMPWFSIFEARRLDSYHMIIQVYPTWIAGDRYLKPWIIPEPEVMFVPRAKDDECLVLASDGLWDVMTNEEVCDLARRRILLWHKKNGVSLPSERGLGIDPAAQAAAEYLSNRALQKGSKDNITVIVIDLKTQRKFKTKS